MQNLLEKLPKLPLIPEFFKSLPETAGIYTYFTKGKVIYVGKAINLKRRVSSYFDLDLDIKTSRMIGEATHLSYIQVSSELEALLLEARLIRAYMPRYNIAAKDDKHPLYIAITDDLYPRVISCRKPSTVDYKQIYGPFPSSRSVYTVLRMLRRIFPYSDHKLGKRACIYSHIGLCNPCPNEIVHNTERVHHFVDKVLRTIYLKNIRSIKSILDGHIDKVKKGLEKAKK